MNIIQHYINNKITIKSQNQKKSSKLIWGFFLIALWDYDKRYEQFKSNPHKKIELSIWETLEDVLLNMGLPLIPKK